MKDEKPTNQTKPPFDEKALKKAVRDALNELRREGYTRRADELLNAVEAMIDGD